MVVFGCLSLDQGCRETPSVFDLLAAPADRKKSWFWLLCLGAFSCAIPRPPVESPAERWVDASAPDGGDGSQSRPHRTLLPLLSSADVIHLAPGVYDGPFLLPSGTR